jgi:hypothetical protein
MKIQSAIIKIGGMIEKPEGALIYLAIQECWMEQVSFLENVCFKFLVVGVGVVSDNCNEFSSFK